MNGIDWEYNKLLYLIVLWWNLYINGQYYAIYINVISGICECGVVSITKQ